MEKCKGFNPSQKNIRRNNITEEEITYLSSKLDVVGHL
jgi:hypothetical protein